MKKFLYFIATACVFSACTDNFEKYNRNQYGISAEELARIPQGGNQLIDLQKLVLPEQENSYQMAFDMLSGYGGYSTTSFTADYQVYNPRANWVNYIFDDTNAKIYKAFNDLKSSAKADFSKDYYALGVILRAGIVHWLADIYGGLPYSQQEEGKQQIPYDTQRDLYLNLCQDISRAVQGLQQVDISNRQYQPFDQVYEGDMSKWIKYANSLLLRMAIRMQKVAPEQAKQYAEQAVANGVILANSENAQLKTADNPVLKMSANWGDSRVNAEITEYMNAFSDPRRAKYFTEVGQRNAGKKFFGSRTGANGIITKPDPRYSLPNVAKNSPIVWISAAEVAFLRAEGVLIGWNVGNGKSAEELYKEGIKLSFEQWNANGYDEYILNQSKRGAFVDELQPQYNADFSSDISVNWNDANNNTQKQLARIITQKWIAMFPYGGLEAWAEWRRTGYPNFLPAVENKSAGVVQSITQDAQGRDRGGMRRLPYSTKEYSGANLKVVQEAVQDLQGPDNGGTDLWWAR